MRKLLISPFLFLAFTAFAQQAPPPQLPQQGPPPPQNDFIVPVQMGTDTLKNGKATITVTQQTMDEMKQALASPDYVIMLTPVGDCGPLTLAEKNNNSFVVKEQKGAGTSKGIFQYIMYVKQRRPQRPGRPLLPQPPQQGQQPAQGQQ